MGTIALIVVIFVFVVAIIMIRDEYPADAFKEPPMESHTESQERTQEDVDAAVIEYLSPLFEVSSVGVEIGRCRQRDVDRERERLRHHRDWLRTQTDPMVIKAYERFLDYFEYRIDGAQKAIDTGAKEKRDAESEKRRKEWDDRTRRGRPIPRPDKPHPSIETKPRIHS